MQLLDLPHYLYNKFRGLCKKRRIYSDNDLEDDWYFDLGYHFSFSITVFTVALIFSASTPLIPFFAFLFFAFKYLIDKYNFMYVYPTEFES